MVLQMQPQSAAGTRQQQPKRHSIFRCCIAATDTDSELSDLDYVKTPVIGTDKQQRQQQGSGIGPELEQRSASRWKQLQQQQQQQQEEDDQQSSAIRTVTISSSLTPSDTSNEAAAAAAAQALLQQNIPGPVGLSPQVSVATAQAAAAAAPAAAERSLVRRIAPSAAATYGSAVPSRTVTPLTDLSMFSELNKAAPAAGHQPEIRRKDTAGLAAVPQQQQQYLLDSPSEVHRELHDAAAADRQQQQQQGEQDNNCLHNRSALSAPIVPGSAQAVGTATPASSSSSNTDQMQHSSKLRSSSLGSGVRLLDGRAASRSASSSCHATVSSAGSSNGSRDGSSVVAAAAGAAAQTGQQGSVTDGLPGHDTPATADTDAGSISSSAMALEAHLPKAPKAQTLAAAAAANGPEPPATPDPDPPAVPAAALYREISLSPASPTAAAAAVTLTSLTSHNISAVSSSSGSSEVLQGDMGSVAGAAAASGSGFRFSSSGSFPAAPTAPGTPAAAKPAASPFAQLSLQKTVATTLLSTSQQQQQQLSGRSVITAASVPASLSSFTTAASGTTAAAAAGVRMSSSSGPAVFASVASKTSRISWATSSTVLGGDPCEVFEVLDPETASNTSGHRILKKSASASSMSAVAAATTAASSSSPGKSSARDKLLRVMSFGGSAKLKAAASDPLLGNSGSSGSSSNEGLRSILRRATHTQPVHSSLKEPGKDPAAAAAARRSRSAHESILAQQQQPPLRQQQLSDPGQGLPPLYPTTKAAAGSSSFGSSGRLASAEVQSSSSSLGVPGGSGSSSGGDTRLAVPDKRLRFSLDAGPRAAASNGSSSSSTGSLVSVAVNRMHTARSAPVLSTAAASSTSSGSSTSAGGLSSMGSVSSISSSNLAAAAAGGSSSDPARWTNVQVANAFAEAFLAALAAGDTKWGSATAVTRILHDTAKMVGMDKQLYVGKTAIIRRLNSGMEQLVKMVSAYADNGSSSSAAAVASNNLGQAKSMSDLADQMPKPLLSVTCPDPKTKPSTVVATYTFKWGIRKFTLRDEFIVKSGQIMRLRRSRI